ncbi:hypothetical protein ACFCXH_28410 [Streptomyces nojiriensis]|uniref:hypothetical protein n=1 Tax=Streptomyces nojiriensis TaxID=66374 RepID=UPI0035D6A5E5
MSTNLIAGDAPAAPASNFELRVGQNQLRAENISKRVQVVVTVVLGVVVLRALSVVSQAVAEGARARDDQGTWEDATDDQ